MDQDADRLHADGKALCLDRNNLPLGGASYGGAIAFHSGAADAYSGIPAFRNPSLRRSRCFKYAALVSLNGTGERLRKVETVTSGLVRLYCASAVRASSSRPLKA
jgi:hypothetical protein